MHSQTDRRSEHIMEKVKIRVDAKRVTRFWGGVNFKERLEKQKKKQDSWQGCSVSHKRRHTAENG